MYAPGLIGRPWLRGAEGDGTNIHAYSAISGWSDNDQATWTHNTAVAPDGTTTASRLSDNNGDTRHIGFWQEGNAGTDPWTFSIYCKAAGSRYFLVNIASINGHTILVYFDLLLGVITQTAMDYPAEGTVIFGARCVKARNGWWKLMVSGKTHDQTYYWVMTLSDRATHTGALQFNCPRYVGDYNGAVYLWRPKLVAGINQIIW